MSNPLVAERQDSTQSYTGIGLVESAADIYHGVQDGSWVEGGLGAVGGGLEILSLTLDPIGTLGQYAVSWVIEQVKPLRDALNWLAGDADQIAAYAQTWKNVSQSLGGVATDLGTEVTNGTAGWSGPAADAYRSNAKAQGEHITAAASGAGTIGTVVEVVGVLVGAVRGIVRDLVAECISTLLARLPQWLAEEGLTLGLATPHVVASVATLISKWVGRITDVITKLTRSVEKLRPIMARLAKIWEDIKSGLGKLRTASRGADTPNAPSTVRSAPSHVDAPTAHEPHLSTPDTPAAPSTSATPSGAADPALTPHTTPDAPSTTTTPSGAASPSTTPSSAVPTVVDPPATPTTPSSATPTAPSAAATPPVTTPPTSAATPPGGGGATPTTPHAPGSSGPHWMDSVRGKFTDQEWADFKGAMDKLGTDPTPGNVPGSGALTPHERDLMARAMNEVTVGDGTLMQKVIPDGTVSKYLDGSYTDVGGFVARHQDAGVLNNPADLINGNRLDYVGTPYDVNQPNIHTLEFPASDASLYQTPVGAPSVPHDLPATDPRVLAARDDMLHSVENAGVNPDRYTPSINDWPYTGAGVTAHPTMGVPEFKMTDRLPLPDGATINRYDAAGNKVVVAVYDSVLGWVTP